ncbi:MAG: carboxypeptidase-like regulatory domain-containing protein, partial [Dysgonamonadaceae bacterium]|nr:carboxypeptidase-like regulatory domain-containing protein [Dysgonamonadaceae bacterium]
MKRNILSLAFCMIACGMYAQHSLTGIVKDGANGEAVAYATVALMTADSSIVTGVTTDDAGAF